MSTNLKARVDGLVSYIQQGKILDAMTEFYADNVTMQENNNPATTGLAANIEREKQFLASVKEWKGMSFNAVAIDEKNRKTTIQYGFDFINVQGQPVHYDQVAVQTWKDNKIVNEKFYYNTGAAH